MSLNLGQRVFFVLMNATVLKGFQKFAYVEICMNAPKSVTINSTPKLPWTHLVCLIGLDYI